jgi:hypothetical protein
LHTSNRHLQYGLICWGNSALAITVFQTQRKIIRAIGFRYKRYYKALKSCHELFPKLDILTLPLLYFYECSKFYRKHSPISFKTTKHTHTIHEVIEMCLLGVAQNHRIIMLLTLTINYQEKLKLLRMLQFVC